MSATKNPFAEPYDGAIPVNVRGSLLRLYKLAHQLADKRLCGAICLDVSDIAVALEHDYATMGGWL